MPKEKGWKQRREDSLPCPTTRKGEKIVAFAKKKKNDVKRTLLKERGKI